MRPSYLFSSLVVPAGFLGLALFASACGDDSNGAVTSGSDMATPDDDDDSGAKECTAEGQSKTCTCNSGGTGTKVCKNGKYSSCLCSGTKNDAGKNQPKPQQCKPGYYVGNFDGKYRPGIFGFGFLESGFEVDIAGGKSFFDDSLAPLSFELSEEYKNPGSEFSTFTVGGGCMQGLATAVAITQSPFVARLTGNLDCETGMFEGRLEGYYTLIGIPGADFSFSGPLTAQFNLANESLDDGAWSVEEPINASGKPAGGGNGTWNAMWNAEMAPKRDKNPCDDIEMHGAGSKPDAGVIVVDAGVKTDASTP